MLVTFFLPDVPGNWHVELPAIPRQGDRIAKMSKGTDERGMYVRDRQYYVDYVEWILEDKEAPVFFVSLVLVSDKTLHQREGEDIIRINYNCLQLGDD